MPSCVDFVFPLLPQSSGRVHQYHGGELAPRSVNTLNLRVDYGFQLQPPRPEMGDKNGLTKEQAQRIAAACGNIRFGIGSLGQFAWPPNRGSRVAASC
jgi:hypothetical protein